MPLQAASDYKLFKKKWSEDGIKGEPVETICLHGGTVFITTAALASFSNSSRISERGRVEGLSDSSAKRMRRYLRSCVANYRYMITLTYPFNYESDGAVVKEHLRRFLQELQRKAELNSYGVGFSAFWFLEFQERGAPHFHIFSTYSPQDHSRGKDSFIKKTWYRICGTDDERHLVAGTREEVLETGRDGTISYASKYAAKSAQKEVPPDYKNCGRFWGIHGMRSTVCAVVRFTKHMTNNRGFAEVRGLFYETIKAALMLKRAKKCIRSEGFAMFKIDDDITKTKLRSLMNCMAGMLVPDEQGLVELFKDAELS